ncbi:eukaryotic translation initiation factor 2-alpha kinase 3-like [Hydractinia symbiolongicarpus]|uniref:eukaryotic translation initiation factor 2-alpha kinase 3-like n=1 Tax=Hydractinia symbiolongicarpus TaxID=13093 RepID=UPI00254F2681|nr:eukaryotic translation initiation factor 2-alpha kinase 3-like [Hydractinia symbiolongicarpus]
MLFISCFASLLLVASKIRGYDVEEDDTTIIVPESTSGHCFLENRSLVLVSTIDGKLSCLNAVNGQLLWTMPASWPLISSSISTVKNVKDIQDIHFIPSLDGNLYKWNGEQLENVPLSADFLLGKMKKLPDGSFVVGGKEIVIYGVDLSTGQLRYECSTTGCQSRSAGMNIDEKEILLLRREQQTIRVVDQTSGMEKWNFSVGKYEIDFAGQNQNEVPFESFCGTNINQENSLHFTMQQGIITNSDASSFWSFKFNAPITSAWKLESSTLTPIDILKYGVLDGISSESVDTDSLMYLGIHEGQMYIQQPSQVHQKQGNTFSNELEVMQHPRLTTWRPFISTSSSRTPTLNNDKQLSVLHSLDYPFDNGFVLVSNFNATAVTVHREQTNDYCTKDDADKTCIYENESKTQMPDEVSVPLSITDWWKEIVILSIVIAIGINLGARAVKRRLVAKETKTLSVTEGKNEVELDVRKRSKGSSVSIATDTTEIVGASTSLNSEYTSRYLVDFDHLQCLGKGGFGVVFKAKKKIDDCEYAIKRIYLPRCEEAKEKMMREVKALAALEHPGIVRYFHAWWEAPPRDWQMKTDKNHLIRDLPSTPSYALSHDWLLEVHSIFSNDVEESAQNNNKDKSEYNKASSNDLQSRRSPRKKTNSDDPLGKRFNFDTGVEEVFSDETNINLFDHNDVFYPDDKSDCIDFSCGNEDSFDIVFEKSCNSNNSHKDEYSSHADDVTNKKCRTLKRTKTLVANGSTNTVEESEESTRPTSEKKSRRFVGKCCTRSSTCLTEPPLFLYIQMQLCKQATLKDWLSERTSAISLKRSMDIFMQIVHAVDYFHGQGMMHRDLKPANIFFSLDGSVKVGDFGLVTAITRPSKGKHNGKCFVDENHTGQVGTQLYMSPEQATGRPYSQKVDIYSLGLILFELLCFFSTQMERMQLIYRIKQGILPEDLTDTPQGELVKLLTSEDPGDRPEAKEIPFENSLLRQINIELESLSDGK